MTPDSPSGASKPAQHPVNPDSVDNPDLAGLYLATTQQLRFNAFGSPGSGSWEMRTEFYLLARDGRLYRGRDLPVAPGGDINRFDYAAAQREAPGNYGTYLVQGDQVIMRLGGDPPEMITATRGLPDTLEIRGTRFKRGARGA